jgi:hypothetical protein
MTPATGSAPFSASRTVRAPPLESVSMSGCLINQIRPAATAFCPGPTVRTAPPGPGTAKPSPEQGGLTATKASEQLTGLVPVQTGEKGMREAPFGPNRSRPRDRDRKGRP